MKTSMLLRSLVLVASTLSIASALAQPPPGGSEQPANAAARQAKTPTLTRQQLDQLLADPTSVLIVDVRRPDELTSIGGFPVYLNVQLAELERHLAWIPRDRKIVTVSNHAGRAGRAGDLLAAHGFNVVGRIGAQDYEAQGGTLTKIAPKAPALVSQSK